MNDRTEQIIASLQGLGTSPYRLYTNQEVIDHLKELQAAMARGVFEKTHAENLRDKDIMLHFKTLAEEYGLAQTDTYCRFETNMRELSYTIGTYIKGMCGERMARKSLKLLSLDKNIRILYNVQLEDEDVQAEYDAIVVAPYGLFVVEVKNWDGDITITPSGLLTKDEGKITYEHGRVYIIYTVREVQESLCCAEHKAVKLFRELEQADLIERKRRGLGRPSLIYVKNFSSGLPKAQIQNCANSNSCAAESAVQVRPKSQSNKTDKNKTERNHPFLPDETDRLTQREQLEDYFYQALEVELLLRLCPDDEDAIYQIVDLLVDTCSTKRKMLRMQNELGNAEPYFAATSPVLDLTVIRPDDAPHILPCFDEADEGISISEDEPLSFRYNPKQVIKLMGKRYLVGPVIFHRFDDDGNFASLTMSDMYAIQKYLESSSVTLMIDRDKLTCICID